MDIEIVNDTLYSYYKLITDLSNELAYKGQPIYYTPNNIFGLTKSILLIPKTYEVDQIDTQITTYDELLTDKVLKLIPPGQTLSEKIEKTVNTKFSSMQMFEIISIIEQTLIHDFEMLKSIDFNYTDDLVNIRMTGSVFLKMYQNSDVLINKIGDPLVSSIVCAISRSTRSLVFIRKLNYDNNKRILEVELRLLDKISDLSACIIGVNE